MGLFRRKSAEAVDAAGGIKKFGHAAFDPADVEDARRGRPATSLEGFAGGSGLRFLGSQQMGAFLSTLPTWPDYIFNACVGPTAGGRLGLVAHELFEVEAHNGSVQGAGSFYDVRVNTRMSGWEVAGISQREVPNEPFAGNAVWIPTTTVHVRAPETLVFPVLRLSRSRSFAIVGDNELDRFGLPGFRVRRGDDDALLSAVVPAIGPWLSTRTDAHVDLRAQYGVVALTVNGYRADPADLGHLLTVTDAIAGLLADLAGVDHGTAFDALGPPASTTGWRDGIPKPHPLLAPKYAELARAWGMWHEDPRYLTTAFGRCPIPGMPSGVLAGQLPGVEPMVRLTWHEHGGRTSGTIRAGMMVPARPGASTPLGGIFDAQRAMYVEVADGVACCWRQRRNVGELGAEDLVRDAVATLGASGLSAL